MKKFVILLLLVSFLLPALRSIAYSSCADHVCSLDEKDCKYGGNCPLMAKRRGEKAVCHVGHGGMMAGVKSGKKDHRCNSCCYCGCKKKMDWQSAGFPNDEPCMISSFETTEDPSCGFLIEKIGGPYKKIFSSVPDKPPSKIL